MQSSYYRAIATCSFLKKELEKEQTARKAMALCFQKIRKSLDMYKGHLINRIRFHMDRHHTEYVRSVNYEIFEFNNTNQLTERFARSTMPERTNGARRYGPPPRGNQSVQGHNARRLSISRLSSPKKTSKSRPCVPSWMIRIKSDPRPVLYKRSD